MHEMEYFHVNSKDSRSCGRDLRGEALTSSGCTYCISDIPFIAIIFDKLESRDTELFLYGINYRLALIIRRKETLTLLLLHFIFETLYILLFVSFHHLHDAECKCPFH